jgi:hypothetical protein
MEPPVTSSIHVAGLKPWPQAGTPGTAPRNSISLWLLVPMSPKKVTVPPRWMSSSLQGARRGWMVSE